MSDDAIKAALRVAAEGILCVAARWLVRAAVWLLPDSRVKDELNAFANAWAAAVTRAAQEDQA